MNRDQHIDALRAHFGSDERHIDHSLKVLGHAEAIADEEDVEPALRRLVFLAALYHDVGIKPALEKYGSSAAPYQEREGAPVVREILRRLDEPEEVVDRVAYIVGSHHTRAAIDGVDFQIVWEADLLVNIDEQGMAERSDLGKLVDDNFSTAAGRRRATELYLRDR
ncbi:MAG: HD domain-containing protein [Spirochaetota bacterium]